MHTSFTQRTAVYGLFMAVWSSMANTQHFTEMVSESYARSDGIAIYNVDGQIASWKTYVGTNTVSWSVGFRDVSLGGWGVGLFHTGVMRYMWWYPDFSNEIGYLERDDIFLDADTYTRMFETLRQAAAAYIKYYRFSVDRDALPLIGDILAP